MKHEESRFTGYMNFNIYWQCWLPEREIKAIVLIAHGYAEHSGRYMNVVNYFVPKSYAVYALDHRGHGRSDGNINEVSDFSSFVTDLKNFFDIIRQKHPDKKIFLIGHSMGSVISLLYTIEYQHELAGLVISGGGIAKPGDPPATKRFTFSGEINTGTIPQGLSVASNTAFRTGGTTPFSISVRIPPISSGLRSSYFTQVRL